MNAGLIKPAVRPLNLPGAMGLVLAAIVVFLAAVPASHVSGKHVELALGDRWLDRQRDGKCRDEGDM